jgi:hypothetical protein
MNIFASLKTAKLQEIKPQDRAEYLTQGDYAFTVAKCETIDTKEGPAFVVRLTITESNSEKHPVGSERQWFQRIYHKSAVRNLVEFCLSVLGVNLLDDAQRIQAEVEVMPRIDEIMTAASGPAQFLTGYKGKVQVRDKPTKTGGMFSHHNWRVA